MLLSHRIAAGQLLLECDAEFAVAGENALKALAGRDAKGPALAAGSRVQFGWSVLTMAPEPEGLRVMAPDYARDPMRDLDRSLDATFRVVRDQVEVLRSTGATGLDARFDSLILLDRRLETSADLFLRRGSPANEDSGWVVGDLHEPPPSEDPSALRAVRVYELLKIRPSLLAPLALPEGWFVAMLADRIDRVIDESAKDRWPPHRAPAASRERV
jgi:hypothetical protein